MRRNRFRSRRNLARLGILLTLVLFVAVNLLAEMELSRHRLDLTQEDRFTLSPTTEAMLTEIDEPITLRLYVSSLLTGLNPGYAGLAERVRDMLETFQRLSRGRITLEVYDPQPFSPEEDRAVADGIQGLSLGDGSDEMVYFGLAGRNSTDDSEMIRHFSPARAGFLEYDLARAVASLANPEKGAIGLMGAIPLAGDQSTGFRPEVVFSLLQQVFRVTPLDGADGKLPDDISVLLLVQPEGLSEGQLYAIDQFVLRGGRLLVFADPFSERMAAAYAAQGMPPLAADLSEIETLFTAWGFRLPEGQIAADRLSARRVVAQVKGRQVVTDYVAWLSLPPERFDDQDPTLSQLQVLNLNTAGALQPIEGAKTRFLPLVSTSAEGSLIEVEQVAMAPDPVKLLSGYKPAGEQTLVARVEGPAETAFPDGPPESLQQAAGDLEALKAAHRNTSEGDIRVLAVADSDVLMDDLWLRGDQGSVTPIANNGDFLLNALDDLSGQVGLTALRGRGLIDRPFEVVERLQREAELKFRTREEELTERIRQAETEIGKIEQDAEGGAVLTPEQEASVDRLRIDLLQARRELREVQRSLRNDLERLVARVELVNIAGVPLVLACIGLAVALVRRRRAQRRLVRD